MNGLSFRRARLAALVSVVALAGSVLGWVALSGVGADSRPVMLMKLQPVRMPAAVAAASAGIPDDVPVIGVTVGGRCRAYTLAALDEIDLHVRNDLLDGVPVTVAHCPRTGCTRVYIDPDGRKPLAIALGGWAGESGDGPNGVMLLRVGMDHFYHDTGDPVDGWADFPYPLADFERTTWGAWRRAHPDTDIVAVAAAPDQTR